MQTALTRTERNILTALSQGEASSASFNALHFASGCTIRGFRRVLHSMEDRGLLYRSERAGLGFTLTSKGLTAADPDAAEGEERERSLEA